MEKNVRIIKDVDAIWHVEEYDVVFVGTTIYNLFSNGFQNKCRLKYPVLQDAVMGTKYADIRKYGTSITVMEKPAFEIMFVCGYPNSTRDSLNYEALEKCLSDANKKYAGKRCMMPIIGLSRFDGNGDRERVFEIYERALTDVDIDIYDYFQLNRREETEVVFRYMLKYKYTDHEKFEALWYDRFAVAEKLYLKP